MLRETFRTSRLLEFCNQRELVAQTGHSVGDWPLVVIKELTDNALDIAEERGIAPVIEIEISTQRGEIVIRDNGPGIPSETTDGILDYTIRVSSREAYVSPTRGAQGNALKTIIAMPFALDGVVGETLIEAQGIAHLIRFAVDPIRQEPRISCNRSSSMVTSGTRVTVRWPAKACQLIEAAHDRFLPFVWDFVALNPHLAVTLYIDGHRVINWYQPTDPEWQKWKPSDPIPPHWYTPEALQRYIAACVHRDREHGIRIRSVRDFLGGFRGLSGTEKRSLVLEETGLFRAPLDAFFPNDRVDYAGIAELLAAMRRHSRPVKPEALGLIGEDHFRSGFATDGADQDRFRYCRELELDDDGLPFVVEAAFAPTDTVPSTPVVSGVNWSAAILDPFRSLGSWHSLKSVLSEQHIRGDDPVVVAVHIACPRVQFADRGKSAAALNVRQGNAVIHAVRKVTKAWSEAREAEQRAQHRQRRATEREIEAHAKAERTAEKRARAVTVGTGALHREIADAAEAHEVSINALTVLSSQNDPYRLDTTEGHANGKWFAERIAELVPDPDQKVHLRGLFYRIVAAADVKRPDGSPFINDLDCWVWLQNKAAKAARWLGYVPFERIRDERNEAPRVISYVPSARTGAVDLTAGDALEVPELPPLLPRIAVLPPVLGQPFRIILVGEKSSLAEVLEPIAEEVQAELLLPTGEMSDTMIAEMAARAAEDDRPSVVLYVSDFDPSGHQMPHSLSRKLQALRTLLHHGLKIEVHRIALTFEQVHSLGLPSTPLKATEKRAKKWREKMGHEQTEIDALAALRPDELRRIAREALKPFYDFGLDYRCTTAADQWREKAERRLATNPVRAGVEQSIKMAHEIVKAANGSLRRAIYHGLAKLREGEIGIEPVEIPLPELKIDAAAPPPLFTTDDDFVTATRKLITSKALDDADADDH